MSVAEFKMFPEDHVWIPTHDGLFSHRPVTKEDKQRRALVTELLTRPVLDKGKRLTKEMEKEIAERKAQIRADLEQLPAPYEIQG